jgi:flagellar biosynthetic protein FlhB
MAGDSAQKTEKPTPKRLREAREKGQIARSQDLNTWAAMLATTVLLQVTVQRGAQRFGDVLDRMGPAIAEADQEAATRFSVDAAWNAMVVIAPLLLGMVIIALVTGFGQVGLKPSVKRLKPDFSRLNPFKGMKRIVSASSWWEVAKAVVKTIILVVIAWPAMTKVVDVLTTDAGDSLDELAAQTARTGLLIIRNVSIAGLGIAVLDYLWQRRRLTKQLMMSRQELREEHKQQEGNPEVRRAIRSRQMAIGRNRMISLVSNADVVVVNPTHFAVALRYEADRGAPEVVAKGAGHIAARIRAEAERHGVPIVREPVLTRALFKSCEVGQLIPLALYEAVAHLLAFVFALRARGRASGFHELPDPAPVPVPA